MPVISLLGQSHIFYSNDMESDVTYGGTQSSDKAYSGQYSEKLSGSDVYSLDRFDDSSRLPELDEGETFGSFLYELWLNDNGNATQTYKLLVRFGDEDNGWQESDFYETEEISVGSDWQQITFDLTDIVNARMGEGYDHITRLGIRAYNNSTFTDYYVDDVSVTYTVSGGSATAPEITQHPASQTKNVGESATFSVTATGSEPLSYQWYRNGTAVSGATTASYTTETLDENDNGDEFYCTVSNSAGSVTSNTATLTVNSEPGSSDTLVLIENGTSRYKIYYGEGESEIIRHAAQELGMHLDDMSGADVEVTTDPEADSKLIVIGRNNPLAEAIADQLDLNAVKYDGFRILAQDEKLYIVGAIDRGTLYGTYYLVDNYYGYHWYSPTFEVVPSLSTITVPASVNDLQNPRFMYREIFADSDNEYIRQHNYLNGNRFHRTSLTYEAGVDTWAYGPTEGHNFVDICGDYENGGQILMMSDGARAEAADYFVNKIAEEGVGPWYNFSQEDNGWIPDDESQSFADDHGGALSAPVLDMVVDVADRVRQTYPDARMSTFAYQWSFKPPVGMTVPEYVMVETAPIEANFGYPYYNEENADFDFEQWDHVAATLGVWDYITNFQNYLQPWPNIYPMCENIQYFADHVPSMISYFGQGPYGVMGGEFAELRRWLAGRLLWNPDQDYHALVDQFCDEYYGPASDYIKQYIDLMHQTFEASADRLAAKTPITADYLTLDFIMQADQLMASADSVATGDYAKHVHNVRLGVDMTILLREHLYKAQAEEEGKTWVEDPDRRTRFDQYAEEAGITDYNEGSSLADLQAAMDVDRVVPPTPDFIQPDQEWKDYQDLDYKICCGVTIVQDNLASDHGAAKELSDGAWAIQMPLDLLPTYGEWELYAYARDEGANGVAFEMGPYPDMHTLTVYDTDVEDGQYHWFQFLGGPYKYETGRYIFFACNSGDLYVDRVVAVRTDEVGKSAENVTEVDKMMAKGYLLGDNYPNPFYLQTKITYAIPEKAHVILTVYDVNGNVIKRLVDELQEPGEKQVCFHGDKLANGLYYYKIEAKNFIMVKAMMLMK